jgi:sugar phosphate isomerase/epimerase
VRAGVIDSVLRFGEREDGPVFERARRSGFAGVEVALSDGGLTPRRVEGLRRAKEETELEIPSLILGSHNVEGGIADEDPAVARHAVEEARAAIAGAAELGADVVLVPFFLRAELRGERDVARCADAFRALCPVAESARVALCFEGTLPAGEILSLADRVASPAFGCYFDLGNPLVSGLDPPTEARVLGSLIRRVHFKDSRARRGDCRPGLGRVDYAACADALADAGYEGWLVFETPPAPPEVVARDLAFARRFFPSLEPAVTWPRFGAFTHEVGVPIDRLAATCRELGIETVQLSRSHLEEWLESPQPLDVPVAGIGAYKNLVAPDERERRRNLAFVARCLELAPLLGTSVVSTHAGTRHPTERWADAPENRGEQAWALLLDAVEELLPAAERSGSVLALEASVNSVLRTVAQVVELLDRFPSPHLQLVCDPYNVVSRHLLPAQERVTKEFLDRFEDRFVLAHVKDVGPDGAEASTPRVGAGVFAQQPYFEFLRERRSDLPLVLEHLGRAEIPAARQFVTKA